MEPHRGIYWPATMAPSNAPTLPLPTVLEAVRVSRERGDLGTARRALLHFFARSGEVPQLLEEAGYEAEALAKELVIRGAALGGLEACLCAQGMGRDQARNFDRITARFPRWRPEPASIGAAKDGLLAGATGTFLTGTFPAPGKRPQFGRIVSLSGGITGTGTEAFRRVLNMAHEGVDWLLLDAKDLSYVGSSGLAIVVKSAEQLRGANGGVVLFQPSSNLKLLVETLGLADSLHPVEDLSAALLLIHGA